MVDSEYVRCFKILNIKNLNPFADYGKIIYGDRFIGRLDSIRVIESRIINPPKPANLAIIGLPRIGKSSLAFKAIMEREKNLISSKSLPIWIDVSEINQIIDFFCNLISECVEKLRILDLIDSQLNDVVNQIYDENLLWTKRFSFILKFFKLIRNLDYKIIIILDEFDHARKIFKDTAEGFQKLRALSYNPKYSVTFVTTTRRSVKNIEKKLKGSSTFYETFMNNNLGVFDDDDIEKHFNKYTTVDIILTDDEKNKILKYCGKHPFLLDILGFEIIEIYQKEKKINVDKAFSHVEEAIVSYYDHLINILKEDGTFSKLLQIVIGSQVGIIGADINILLSYSLIEHSNEGGYRVFSQHFHDYLEHLNESHKHEGFENQVLREILKKIPSYKGKELELADFKIFLNQFPEKLRYSMLMILRRIKEYYFTQDDLIKRLKIEIDKIPFDKNTLIFLVVFDSIWNKSNIFWSYLIKKFTRILGKRISIYKASEILNKLRDHSNEKDIFLIFIDDVIGTGHQFIKAYNKDFKNQFMEQGCHEKENIKLYLIAGVGSAESRHLISKKTNLILDRIRYSTTIRNSDKAFYKGHWKDINALEKLKDFLKSKDNMYWDGWRAAPSKEGLAFLVVLEWNTPNSTISCLWKETPDWKALFPRS